MQSRVNPVLVTILVVVAVLAVGLLIWQYTQGSSSGEVPQSAYPQARTDQPSVEAVGPPPDVVPAGTPGSSTTPPPMKGR